MYRDPLIDELNWRFNIVQIITKYDKKIYSDLSDRAGFERICKLVKNTVVCELNALEIQQLRYGNNSIVVRILECNIT